MTDEELGRLLANVESDRSERQQSLADPDKVRQAICTFANDLPNHGSPGVLFIGAKDDGSCAGLAITDVSVARVSAPIVLFSIEIGN
jgi:ATP-dependent DNA helicase RecG